MKKILLTIFLVMIAVTVLAGFRDVLLFDNKAEAQSFCDKMKVRLGLPRKIKVFNTMILKTEYSRPMPVMAAGTTNIQHEAIYLVDTDGEGIVRTNTIAEAYIEKKTIPVATGKWFVPIEKSVEKNLTVTETKDVKLTIHAVKELIHE